MTLTLDTLNSAARSDALQLLDGLYEHSPWIADKALYARPFRSLAHLKYEMTQVVERAGKDKQLELIRAHPELAGKAMISDDLTAESTSEQSRAGFHSGGARPARQWFEQAADHRDVCAPAAKPS
jgi:beta-ureidopropionase / N-carbamoyl-L-amino-acid hydrolase